MASVDLVRFMDEEVYPVLYSRLDSAFPEFGWRKGTNRWTATSWPSGFPFQVENERPDRLMVYEDNPARIVVHGHYGEEVHLLAYVSGGSFPRGKDFVDRSRELAEKAGVDFPEKRLTSEEADRARKKEARRSALADLMSWARSVLWSSAGDEARAYLREGRGLTDDEMKDLGLGLYSSVSEARAYLEKRGHGPEALEESAALWDKLEGYVESEAEWECHYNAVLEDFSPVGYMEEVLVDRVASLLWRLGRAVRYETGLIRILQSSEKIDRWLLIQEKDYPENIRGEVGMLEEEVRAFETIPGLKDKAPVKEGALGVLYRVADLLEVEIYNVTFPQEEASEDWNFESISTKWTAKDVRDCVAALMAASETDLTFEEVWKEAKDKAAFALELAQEKLERMLKHEENLRREGLLPQVKDLDVVIRYETHLERGLVRSLRELQRLQSARGAGTTPPPVLDVALSEVG